MHSSARSHHPFFVSSFSPANLALIILFTLLPLIFLFLFMTITAQPAFAQNSVPPTARQAATMPQFASRLAHPAPTQAASRMRYPAQPRASYKNPLDPRGRAHRGGPLDANEIYDNGPINGSTDAWTINFGFVVSDTLPISNNGTINGLTFGAWLFEGDVLQTVEVSITSAEFGGTTYFDQVVSFTQSGCSANQYGFNVCTETSGNFTGPNLAAGTYWVNLSNAVVNNGDPVYWDENSGPSMASENSVGTIPSEAFTVEGTAGPPPSDYACPAPQNGFHDLHDFDANAAPTGVVLDAAGNLYGALQAGGSYGAGLLYQLGQRAGRWFFHSLYSFVGGSNGNSPNSVIVGPQGNLYGAASGGIQACHGPYGPTYCGVIYEAQPPANVCPSALCGWNETTLYQFTGGTDAWGGSVSAFDAAGNLYGISPYGGAYQVGAVFELTPSSGGWTEKILYSFTGQNDGRAPASLLLGHDGNLYGTAEGGLYGLGVVFQLVPSGGGWAENVIYAFTGGTDGRGPGSLIQNSQGNLFGLAVCYAGGLGGGCTGIGPNYVGVIFGLSQSGDGWVFNLIHVFTSLECPLNGLHHFVTYSALAMDAAGNLYATAGGASVDGELWCGSVVTAGGFPLVTGTANIFDNLTSDASGTLYGTTGTCGFGTLSRRDGMLWQY